MSATNPAQIQYEDPQATTLDTSLWHGSFNGRESTIQQLSPYIGKMKSGMAKVLIDHYSDLGDVVLDPFCGSGVVPFQAALAGRSAWANDLNPYAYVLTRGKLEAPPSKEAAIERAKAYLKRIEQESLSSNLNRAPDWVREFFHPDTLREILTAFRLLVQGEENFLLSCLLGILHHQRPGFLSYPASHLVPYLRTKNFPPEQFPEMYEYRDLRSRLLAKVERAYRRPKLPANWEEREYQVWCENAMALPIKDGTVDVIISSPPYFGALDYARDNRLRLWFLGHKDWKEIDESLTASRNVYISQMSTCLKEMCRVLKSGKRCVLVLGDVERNGKTRRTAELLADLATDVLQSGFVVETIYDDRIPDKRRSRRQAQAIKFERILVMCKS